MPAPSVELRFVWPASKGSASFTLTRQEALQAAVALRGLGLGLTLKGDGVMVTTRTDRFAAAELVLARKVRGRY